MYCVKVCQPFCCIALASFCSHSLACGSNHMLASCFHCHLVALCLQFYQLLKAQKDAYPAHVLPAGKDLVAVTGAVPEQVTRTL